MGERGRGETGEELTRLHKFIACSDIAEKVYRKLLESLLSLNRLFRATIKSVLKVDKCHERFFLSLYVHKGARLSFVLR